MNQQIMKKKPIQMQKTRLSVPAFLLKTYEIIENKDCQDVVSWSIDGQSFVIKNINEFSEKVLSNYFKHKNFSSFVRQLNMYDFHKIRNENNETEFRHRLFQRGNKNLLIEIKRKGGENGFEDEPESEQMPSMDVAEMDRIKHDYSVVLQDLMSVKQKYSDLERVVYQVASSIDKAYNQSKHLEGEFLKFKAEQSEKTENIVYFLSNFITNQRMSENNQSKQSTASDRLLQNNKYTKNRSNFGDSDLDNNDLVTYMNNNSLNIKKEEGNNNNNISNNNNNNNNNGQSESNFNNQSELLNHELVHLGGNTNNLDLLLQSQTNQQQQHSQQNQRQQSLQQSRQFLASESENQNNFNIQNSHNPSNIHGGQIDSMTESLMPFIQRKEDPNQLQQKIQCLAETLKNTKLPSMQRPEALFNVLQQFFNSSKTMTVSEEAVNKLSLGGQAKRMLSSSMFGGNSINQGRQNISIFENMQMKRIRENSQQEYGGFGQDNTVNTNNNKISGLGIQLGLVDGLDSSAEFKAMSLFQQQHQQYQSQKNIPGNVGNGLYSQQYFNAGDASPRLPFNIYPSPTPNSGGNGTFQNNNTIHQGISTFLNSPSPNMSPMLLRDMEEFVSQNTQRGGYSLGLGQNSIFEQQLGNNNNNNNDKNLINNNNSLNSTSAGTFDNSLGIVNNFQNNKRISENLLRSLQTDNKTDRDTLLI